MKTILRALLASAFWSAAITNALAGSGTITTKDAGGVTRTFDVVTDGSGNFVSETVICDQSAAATCASVGTAGSPSTNALTVQAVTIGHGTAANAMRVELPTDGTGLVNAAQSGTWNITNVSGTVSLPTGAATSANQTNASQKTQIVDGSGNVIASTSNALNVAITSGGGSGGTAITDNTTFGQGSTNFTPVGCINPSSVTNIPSGDGGAFLCTPDRNLYANLNKVANTTLGTPASYGTTPTGNALSVNAFVTNALTSVNDNADGVAVATPFGTPVVNHNYGFNGTSWDRLQVDGNKYLKTATQATENHIGEIGSNQIAVQVAQTVTASSAYATGNSIGGLMTVANAARVSGALGASGTGGVLQNVAVNSKSVQSTSMEVWIFNANPSGSTCTDKTAFSLVTADFDKVVGVVQIPGTVTNNSGWFSGGTASVGQGNNQAMAYDLSSATSLFACLITRSTPTFTATSDISVKFNLIRS